MIRIKPDIIRATARICIQRPHLSSRKTARAADCSPGSALKIRDSVQASALTLEALEELDDVALLTKLFGDPTMADAVMDRIFHMEITLKGESWRKRKGRGAID